MRVHSRLGPGLRERMYQRALALEFERSGLGHEEEKYIRVAVDERRVGALYLDHVVEGALVVEVKATRHNLTKVELAQAITYLAASDYGIALLLNFGGRSLEIRRVLRPKKVDDWRKYAGRYLTGARTI